MAEFGIPIDLVTPRGQLNFNPVVAPAGGRYLLTGLEGMDSAVLRTSVEDIPQRDGAVVQGAYESAIYPVFTGVIVADDPQHRTELENRLRTYLPSMLRADGGLYWTPSHIRNRVPNPSFEVDALNWTAANATLTRLTPGVGAVFGSAHGLVNSTGAGTASVYPEGAAGAMRLGMQAGFTYTFSAYVYVPSTEPIALADVKLALWDDQGGLQNTLSASPTAFNTWQRLSVTRTIRSSATAAFAEIMNTGAAGAGEEFYVDGVQLEAFQAGAPMPYTDGAQPNGRWEGAAHASVSYLGQPPSQRAVRLLDGPDIRGGWHKEFQFALVAADPLAYSQQVKTSAQIAINGAAVTVYNGGLRDTYPLVRVYGPVTDFAVTNNTSGKFVAFFGTVADGAYVDVYMRQEALIRNDGANMIANLNATASNFWALAPGANSIVVTGTSPGANAKAFVFHQDAW